MLDRFGVWFLVVGPIGIIIVGMMITLWFILEKHGQNRWRALFYGPGLTGAAAYVATFLVVRFINPSEGSGFLLGGIPLGLFIAGLIFYYPILLVIFLIQFFRQSRSKSNHQ